MHSEGLLQGHLKTIDGMGITNVVLHQAGLVCGDLAWIRHKLDPSAP